MLLLLQAAEGDKAAEGEEQQDGEAPAAAAPDEDEGIDEAAAEQATDDLALTIIMGMVSSRSMPPPAVDAGGSSHRHSSDRDGRDSREGRDRDRDRDRDRERDRELPGPPLSHGECGASWSSRQLPDVRQLGSAKSVVGQVHKHACYMFLGCCRIL